jgi:ElaB/YqjD/DUF883 family membrane-anchored ribosome-binding protein
MTSGAGAQAREKYFAENNKSDAEQVQDNIKDLGDHVGQMASRQYEHAQDMATDAVKEAGDAIRRNPLTSIGIGLGVGFLLGVSLGGRS